MFGEFVNIISNVLTLCSVNTSTYLFPLFRDHQSIKMRYTIILSACCVLIQPSSFVSSYHASNSYLNQLSLPQRNQRTPSTTSSALPQLNPKETALILIEYQNEFLSEGGKLHEPLKECLQHTDLISNSVKLTKAARSKGCSIFHVPIMFASGTPELYANSGILNGIKEGGAFEADTWNTEFHSEMTPEEGDVIVKGKLGLCGFFSTNLDFLLRQRRIKNVIIGGLLTNCCVESTMRTAYEAGYQVYTLTDGSCAMSVEAHESMFKHNAGMFSTITNYEEVENAFE